MKEMSLSSARRNGADDEKSLNQWKRRLKLRRMSSEQQHHSCAQLSMHQRSKFVMLRSSEPSYDECWRRQGNDTRRYPRTSSQCRPSSWPIQAAARSIRYEAEAMARRQLAELQIRSISRQFCCSSWSRRIPS